MDYQITLRSVCLDTPLGQMIAIADNTALYLLEFLDRPGLEAEILRLVRLNGGVAILPGSTDILCSIESELKDYFNNKLKQFKTPILLIGTTFQQSVWKELLKIPLGQTLSYLQLSRAINKPMACRAVANANGANQLAIIIPCHRVINSDGKVGGYAGGIRRKEWLLKHEK